jgi:cobalt-zinc-cadmium efflux system protein
MSTRIAISLGVTLSLVVIEVIAGLRAQSLALLSDAGHNFTDVIALGLTWYAFRLSAQPSNAGKTFGYHRAGILVAFVNSTTLAVISLGIFREAYKRFLLPAEVRPEILVGVGVAALIVNAGTAWLVKHGSDHDLNLRSAFVHLMADVLSTVGAIVAGILIALTGMNWLDPLVSVFIAVLILWNAWGILRETVGILLESTPRDIDMSEMVRDMMSVEGVRGVHDLHVWSITRSLRALSAHIVTDDLPISDGTVVQREINRVLRERYNIGHATLQLECVGCEPDVLYCDIAEQGHAHEVKE